MLTFTIGNKGWKSKKCRKNQASLSLLNSAHQITFDMGQENAWNFLWWKSLRKTQLLAKKKWKKSIYKGPRAVALILALIASSKAYRPKIEKLRPLLIYDMGYVI